MKNKVIVIRGGSDGTRAAAAKGIFTDGRSLAAVGRSVNINKLSRVRALADEPLKRYPRIVVPANNAGAERGAERVIEAAHEVTGFKPEDIARARAYAEEAGRIDEVIASYRVRDNGTAFAQLSWGEYSIEQIEIVLADLKRIERVLRREEEA